MLPLCLPGIGTPDFCILCTILLSSSMNATQVACRPGLSPLTFDAIPSNLLPHADISRALDPKEWARIQAATFEKFGNQ